MFTELHDLSLANQQAEHGKSSHCPGQAHNTGLTVFSPPVLRLGKATYPPWTQALSPRGLF